MIEQFCIQGSRSSKNQGTNNWLLLLSPTQLKMVINSGDLFTDPKHCRVRTFTTISRCRKCQLLGHSAKVCPNITHCENCSFEHSVTDCSSPLLCINCHSSNQTLKTDFSTSRKSSDTNFHPTRSPIRGRGIGWMLFFQHINLFRSQLGFSQSIS